MAGGSQSCQAGGCTLGEVSRDLEDSHIPIIRVSIEVSKRSPLKGFGVPCRLI